jgi:parallel beta-helix repeat protein
MGERSLIMSILWEKCYMSSHRAVFFAPLHPHFYATIRQFMNSGPYSRRENRNRCIALVLAFSLLPFAACGSEEENAGATAALSDAVTYYVDTEGSDSNPGTSDLPFSTIQRAADVVNPGDTVIVRAGTYIDNDGDNVVVNLRRGGNSSAYVTFRSEPREAAKLDGQNNRTQQGWAFKAGYIRVEGFEITGTVMAAFAGYVSNLQIVSNHIHDIGRECTDDAYGRTGMFFASPARQSLIEGNVIHDIGRYAPGENDCQPTNMYYKNHDHGIYLKEVNDFTVQNNIIYNNKRGWGIHLQGTSTGIHVYHNTFAFPNPYRAGHIIILGQALSSSQIINNIFYQPTTGAIAWHASLSDIEVNRNITYGGTINEYGTTSPPPGVVFSGNLDRTDPHFVNPSSFDFHLQAGSPAINVGLPLSEVTVDHSGLSRPQEGHSDLGAFEYQ